MLLNKMNSLISGAALAVAPVIAFAHPGHDHSHWMSFSIHLFLALSIIGVIGVAAVLYSKRKNPTSNEKV